MAVSSCGRKKRLRVVLELAVDGVVVAVVAAAVVAGGIDGLHIRDGAGGWPNARCDDQVGAMK
jgi:hypothetical protein